MADAVVTFLLENVKQLVMKEAKSLIGMKDQLNSLSTQLELMQSFLQDFERVRHEHETVETVVNQIRELAYDAEDVIDDYVVYTLKYRNHWKRHLPGSGKLGIGKRIKEIKKRIEELNTSKEKMGIEIKPVVEVVAEGSMRRAVIVEEVDVVGFTNDVLILIKQLTNEDPKLAATSIVGMGGLGKTTLALKIFNDSFIKESFEHRALIYVSQQHTLTELMLGIIKCFTQVTKIMTRMGEQELGKELHRVMEGKKYLIVMDDVWKPKVWKYLRLFFPDDMNGSRVLLTTRVAEVAVYANPDPRSPPYYLGLLNEEQSWELFRKKAFLYEDCSSQWEEVGRQIAKKCKGLPLAIVVLGSLISRKRGTFDDWSKAAERIHTLLSERPSECKDILALSYHELPHYLKPCFLYFSAFPEDSQIQARMVIQLWISERLVKPKIGQSLEETAEGYLQTLVDRSLIQVVQRGLSGRVKICSIHDLLRDLCISEAQRERFLHSHEAQDSLQIGNPRRLAGKPRIMHSMNSVQGKGQLRKVRSLLWFSKSSVHFRIQDNMIESMPMLRVLMLKGKFEVSHKLGNLRLLRYLRLSANFEDQSYMCDMLNLQILDASGIDMLPTEIWKLKKLRHLYLYRATYLPQPPQASPSTPSHDNGDSSLLKDLQTLSGVSGICCTAEVFHNVPNLFKLGVYNHLNCSNGVSNNLIRLKHLRKLKLKGGGDPLESLPSQFPPLLAKLTLSRTQLKKDPMPLLEKLPNLQILKLLKDAYTGTQMNCSADGFPRLQVLKVVSLKIKTLTAEKGAMPNLEHLVINDCFNLHSCDGMSDIPRLKVIDLLDPTSKLRQSMAEQFKEKDRCRINIEKSKDDYENKAKDDDKDELLLYKSIRNGGKHFYHSWGNFYNF